MEISYLTKPASGSVLDIRYGLRNSFKLKNINISPRSLDNLKSQLPWPPGHCASATVYVNGISDFVVIPNDSCSVSDEIYSAPSVAGNVNSFQFKNKVN